jgi:putative transposase
LGRKQRSFCAPREFRFLGIKRHKPEEIVTKLRQVDVLVGQGMSRSDAIRQVSITEQTYYRWKKQYGGMGTDQLKELNKLQKENCLTSAPMGQI